MRKDEESNSTSAAEPAKEPEPESGKEEDSDAFSESGRGVSCSGLISTSFRTAEEGVPLRPAADSFSKDAADLDLAVHRGGQDAWIDGPEKADVIEADGALMTYRSSSTGASADAAFVLEDVVDLDIAAHRGGQDAWNDGREKATVVEADGALMTSRSSSTGASADVAFVLEEKINVQAVADVSPQEAGEKVQAHETHPEHENESEKHEDDQEVISTEELRDAVAEHDEGDGTKDEDAVPPVADSKQTVKFRDRTAQFEQRSVESYSLRQRLRRRWAAIKAVAALKPSRGCADKRDYSGNSMRCGGKGDACEGNKRGDCGYAGKDALEEGQIRDVDGPIEHGRTRGAKDGGISSVDSDEGGTNGGRQCDNPSGSELASDSWMVVHRGGLVVAEEDTLTAGAVEAKIDQLLTWMLAPAVHGIGTLGVLGAAERADELLAQHGRDRDAAAREVVAGSEKSVSRLVLNFCLERIPVLGCPTVLLRGTWGDLRSVLIISALYGHDLDSPRVQHEALFCLVPPGVDVEGGRSSNWRGEGHGPVEQAKLLRDTTQKVAKTMIKGALRRATGLQAAADCLELASLLYRNCGQNTADEDEDGFVHVVATPASAARDLFRRKSLASSALLWGSLPVLALGAFAPAIFTTASCVPVVLSALSAFVAFLPRRLALGSLPAVFLAALGLLLAWRTLRRLLGLGGRAPRRSGLRRWFRERFLSQRIANRAGAVPRLLQRLRGDLPQLLTTSVFAVHALLPAVSTYSAVSLIFSSVENNQCYGGPDPNGWDPLHRVAGVALGLYSLSAVVIRHTTDHVVMDPKASSCGAVSLRHLLRLLSATEAVARACAVLAVWTYLSLALDLGATHAVRWAGYSRQDAKGTSLGVMEPVAMALGALPGTNPLQSQRAQVFSLQVVSMASQRRLVDLLSRREVVLRLIGAERLTAQTLLLLLKGVGVAFDGTRNGSNPIAEFLTTVAPPPLCCILVVAVRGQAIILGAAFVLAPWLNGVLGSAPCFGIGIAAGAYATQAILTVWYVNRADMDSPALRLALLVPGCVSGRAKGLLRDVLVGARSRAVQIMAMGLLERIIRYLMRPSFKVA
eukprot:TRINITY_DN24966_c0_g1_i1.p1 TRINITY_DN24966_c0_g1~~TRINITY_DN24966_c0_g1_i1.p1  ORF type:complete len:1086 (-),score=156.91 TRINITY_DN24966_c0_g1_i1:570-3827(-)